MTAKAVIIFTMANIEKVDITWHHLGYQVIWAGWWIYVQHLTMVLLVSHFNISQNKYDNDNDND